MKKRVLIRKRDARKESRPPYPSGMAVFSPGAEMPSRCGDAPQVRGDAPRGGELKEGTDETGEEPDEQ